MVRRNSRQFVIAEIVTPAGSAGTCTLLVGDGADWLLSPLQDLVLFFLPSLPASGSFGSGRPSPVMRKQRVCETPARDGFCDSLLAGSNRHSDCRCSIIIGLQNLVPRKHDQNSEIAVIHGSHKEYALAVRRNIKQLTPVIVDP